MENQVEIGTGSKKCPNVFAVCKTSVGCTAPGRMPRINPHASAIMQDKQLRDQLKWLKIYGFKNTREAQEAGH